jgi:hypothetical protein
MVVHALHHFPLADADGVPQALRLVSGAGVPTYHREGPGIWGVTWTGHPHELTPRESWIAVWADRHVYGWIRFCHTDSTPASIGDPAHQRNGVFLYTDRYVRFPAPVLFHPDSKRSRYLDASEAAQLNVPTANGGAPVAWVDLSGVLQLGCPDHP